MNDVLIKVRNLYSVFENNTGVTKFILNNINILTKMCQLILSDLKT